MKRPKKLTALLLCVVMIFGTIPGSAITNVFAADCAHRHTDECYVQELTSEDIEHTHTDECYKKELECDKEECTHAEECNTSAAFSCGKELHTHDEVCYDADDSLTCTLEEHSHTNECVQKELSCQLAEHTHTEDCYTETLNCQHVCDDKCEEIPKNGIALNCDDKCEEIPKNGIVRKETTGTIEEELDGDWAYISEFKIIDDPKTDYVDGILDGSSVFDTDSDVNSWTYSGRQGNDSDEHNGKVRSFDTVTYYLQYATDTYGSDESQAYNTPSYVKRGWMNYEMVLPYPDTSAVFQAKSMAWIGDNMKDAEGLAKLQKQTNGYYIYTEKRNGVLCQILRGKHWLASNEDNPYAIPGSGTLHAVVQVLAMKEGDTLQPGFSAWMEYNDVGKEDGTCDAHGRSEIVSAEVRSTEVTAEVRLNIEVKAEQQSDSLLSADFNAGDSNAPNREAGLVIGYGESYTIGVYLWSGSADKGKKGLMAPDRSEDLTFDLQLTATVASQANPTNNIPLDDKDYAPLLWALGSNDDAMDWRGRTKLSNMRTPNSVAANKEMAPEYMRGDNACHNGGTWKYELKNDGTISVTITGMEIDLTDFPDKSMDGNTYNEGEIPISSGQCCTVQPVKVDGKNIMTDTSVSDPVLEKCTITTTLADNNMKYQYQIDGVPDTVTLTNEHQTNLEDDSVSFKVFVQETEGTYRPYILWSRPFDNDFYWVGDGNPPTDEYWVKDTIEGNTYLTIGGDPVMSTMAIGNWFGIHHKDDVDATVEHTKPIAAKVLAKFDPNIVTPTGKVTFLKDTQAQYDHTVLYAAKKDGTGWISDEEMKSTNMTDLRYYASRGELPAGAKCVGMLVEYRPKDGDISKIRSKQHLFADVGLTVNADVPAGTVSMCTIECMTWNMAAYTAANGSIPTFAGTPSTNYPTPSWTWHPENYEKGALNELGYLEGDSGGDDLGDALVVITAKSTIKKTVAQKDNTENKYSYQLDNDQRFVDYKLDVSTEYLANHPDTPQGITTTVTIVDAFETSELTYVLGSAYYGGTYVQAADPGRQGTVSGGSPLEVKKTMIDKENGMTYLFFEIPDIEIGTTLKPIYLTMEIGTRGDEIKDVKDGQEITNTAISMCGVESSLNTLNSSNRSETNIIVSKLHATSRSKVADNTYIEKGDSFGWTINVGNNGGNIMENVVALDVLPYVGDGKGTNFTGIPSLIQWNIDKNVLSNFSSENWKIMYTEDENVRGTKSSEYTIAADIIEGKPSGPKNVIFKNITESGASVDWNTGVITLPDHFYPTAMVMVGTIPGNQTLRIKLEVQMDGVEQGDVLVNQLDGYPTPIYVVKRSLEGIVWRDEDMTNPETLTNKDGIRDDSEVGISGVSVTLLKLKNNGNPEIEADYEVVKDRYGNDVTVLTDKQMDVGTGVSTDYKTGRYQFTGLAAGIYGVRFTNGPEGNPASTSIAEFTVTKQNQGTDDTIDSDAAPTYNAETNELEQGLILGLDMTEELDSTTKLELISRDNDMGVHTKSEPVTYTLTISKEVVGNMRDHEKDFHFIITLKDTDKKPITGTFDYTGGTITFNADGEGTITLRHGQSITITGIPEHSSYTVVEEEANKEGYTTTISGNENNTDLTENAVVEFTNTFNLTPPSGIVFEIWPYILVILLAIGGALLFLAFHNRKKVKKAGTKGKGYVSPDEGRRSLPLLSHRK